MGKVIKNFEKWQRVNEGESWLDSLANIKNVVASYISGGDMTKTSIPKLGASSTSSTSPSSTSSTSGSSSTVKPESAVTKKPTDKSVDKSSKAKASATFDNLNLKSSPDFEKYEDSCNKWIDSQKPFFNSKEYHELTPKELGGGEATSPTNKDYVIGRYFADSAKHHYEITGKYLPWELAMAQCTVEGGLSKTGKYADGKITRPIKTKNPFNVGNTDAANGRPGNDRYFKTIPDGIDAYYKLMTNNYLELRTPDELLQTGNFKNSAGNNYATDSYPNAVADMVSRIKSRVA